MGEASIDLFAEDRAHEEFLKAMIQRLANEAAKTIRIHVRAARGGHGRAMDELNDRSLGLFVEDMRSALQRIQ